MFRVLLRESRETKNYDFFIFTNEVLNGNIPYTQIVSECKPFDTLQLLKVIEVVTEELEYNCLENFVLESFLQRNDPKMLIGLTDEELFSSLRTTIQDSEETDAKIKFAGEAPTTPKRRNDLESMTGSNVSLFKRSIAQSLTNTLEKRTREYHLNYKTKVGMTTNFCLELKSDYKQLERDSCKTFKKIEAEIEEMKYELKEVDEILVSFDNNVVRLGCDPQTGVISSELFVKFAREFLNNGMALCSRMRISSNNLGQEISAGHHALVSKEEKSGIITSVDFQILTNKKQAAKKVYHDQYDAVNFLKDFKGQVGFTMSNKRKELINAENKLKDLEKNIIAKKKDIDRIEVDVEIATNELMAITASLRALKLQNETYSAPKTVDYIFLKEKLIGLERERKRLKQQIIILQMRLKSAKRTKKKSK